MLKTVGALVAALSVLGPGVAAAYMCESLFTAAEQRIKEAEATVTEATDVRIKQKLAEAKGLLEAAKIGHRQATVRPLRTFPAANHDSVYHPVRTIGKGVRGLAHNAGGASWPTSRST